MLPFINDSLRLRRLFRGGKLENVAIGELNGVFPVIYGIRQAGIGQFNRVVGTQDRNLLTALCKQSAHWILRPFTNNDETRWAGTFYVQDMWEVTDRFTLVGGARIDPYRQKIVNNNTGGVGRNIDEPVNFRIGGRYRVSDTVAVHANWGENFSLNTGTDRNGDGRYDVGQRIEGDVAGGRFDLRYRFVVRDGLVEIVVIEIVGGG